MRSCWHAVSPPCISSLPLAPPPLRCPPPPPSSWQALEDLYTHYDGTVRNAAGGIVQASCGLGQGQHWHTLGSGGGARVCGADYVLRQRVRPRAVRAPACLTHWILHASRHTRTHTLPMRAAAVRRGRDGPCGDGGQGRRAGHVQPSAVGGQGQPAKAPAWTGRRGAAAAAAAGRWRRAGGDGGRRRRGGEPHGRRQAAARSQAPARQPRGSAAAQPWQPHGQPAQPAEPHRGSGSGGGAGSSGGRQRGTAAGAPAGAAAAGG